MKTKRCTQCKAVKPVSDFWKHRKSEHVYRARCIDCEKAASLLKAQRAAASLPCATCGKNPRLSYSSYCQECSRTYSRNYVRRQKAVGQYRLTQWQLETT